MSFGVYVHIPFCARACDYCDFAKWVDRAHLVDDYVAACRRDLDRRAEAAALPPATSVFFGGGTPSLLPARDIVGILDAIPRAPGAEVTVECNPDSVDHQKLEEYRAGGVTRISLGVQSMRPHVLAALGRTHDPDNVTRAVGWVRALGFETFNVDVIYGTPGESIGDWRTTLEGILALDPPHVSAYALTVEPTTPLGQRVAGGAPAPVDDDQALMYEVADELLSAAGLTWYEVSNWSRPGHECRHNLLTWGGGDYLAVGCAAHGHDHGRRWWNVRTPERYVERIDAGADPEVGHEILGAPARAEEALTLALRTRAGAVLPRAALGEARRLEAGGLLELAPPDGPDGSDVRAVLTRRGRLLATDVTARLLVAVSMAEARAPIDLTGAAAGTRYH
ncbi:MAG: radical SAM family heme chaperone HemW [Acidimicrobiia bacterium]